MNALPPGIAARIDLRRSDFAEGFGVFDGQERRQRTLIRSYPSDLIIETGTYRGTTTEYLRGITPAPIITIERKPRFYEYSRRRLSGLPDMTVRLGDSPTEIRDIATLPTHDRHAKVFAYLDAHWGRRLPAMWEMLELLTGWETVCIVIDDFKVEGDDGYRYDDYGPGRALDLTLLDGLPLDGVAVFFPADPSGTETGRRRGWVVPGRGSDLVAELSRPEGLRARELGAGGQKAAAGPIPGGPPFH